MLVIDISKCSGCRRCEVFCSFFHTGRVGRSAARIRVEKNEDTGIDVPVVCHQCQEHYCTRCPENAITLTKRGSIEVSPTLCTRCGACETLCPIGAIEIQHEIPFVCDLCGGDPRCVRACEMGAISLDMTRKQAVSLSHIKPETRKMTPHQKRYHYAMMLGRSVHDAWIQEKRRADHA